MGTEFLLAQLEDTARSWLRQFHFTISAEKRSKCIEVQFHDPKFNFAINIKIKKNANKENKLFLTCVLRGTGTEFG